MEISGPCIIMFASCAYRMNLAALNMLGRSLIYVMKSNGRRICRMFQVYNINFNSCAILIA